MKIDLVEEDGQRMLRLFTASPAAFAALSDTIRRLLEDGEAQAFHALAVEGDLTLHGRIGTQDAGVTRDGPAVFDWTLSAEGWRAVADLLAPLAAGEAGFQWLSGPEAAFGLHNGDFSVLASASDDGRW